MSFFYNKYSKCHKYKVSFLKLSLMTFAILSYSDSQAQQDSILQKIKQGTSDNIKKGENIVSKYYTITDSALHDILQVPSAYLKQADGKIEKYTGKVDSTVSKYNAKANNVLQAAQQIPARYIKQVDNKIEKYSNRLTSKTEKTLSKLSKWENKIKTLLEKAHPPTAAKLFGKDQVTFTTMLQKLHEGKAIVAGYKTQYHEYTDKLTTSLRYIETQKDNLQSKYIKPVTEANKKLNKLSEDVANTEAVEKFINERKRQLINEAIKYIGKSKYLAKINKESYYYIETIRNYKEIFSDPKKAEKLALTVLNKIPAFTKFVKENSMLASLFGNSSITGSSANLEGLQTRASVNELIQNRISSGGPNAKEIISQNIQQAQAELTKLKEKLLKSAAGGSSNEGMPDFKPNMQKTKTFLQRLEYGFNYQFGKSNSLMPTTADIAITIGYKLNDKSVIGIGAAYKMGLGNIEKIKIFSHPFILRLWYEGSIVLSVIISPVILGKPNPITQIIQIKVLK